MMSNPIQTLIERFSHQLDRIRIEKRLYLQQTSHVINSQTGKSYHIVSCKNNRFELIPEAELKASFPKAFQYLYSHKERLEHRPQYKNWYRFSAPISLAVHDCAQSVVPLLANKGLFAPLPEEQKTCCLMASGGFSITITHQEPFLPHYVLGLLNSKRLFWYLKSISNRFRGGLFRQTSYSHC